MEKLDLKKTQLNTHMPRLIAWEVTKKCPLRCKHCRASASNEEYAGEFDTGECIRLLDNIASFSTPIVILTGGEPMTREDIYDIAKYGTSIGLRMVMAPCGLLMDGEAVRKIIASGIKRISLSIDGADRETHDALRGVDGAFDYVINAAHLAGNAGLEFQVNTTVSTFNYHQLDRILELALELGAVSYHPFLLVPTGRGKNLAQYEISPEEYEQILTWIYEKEKVLSIQIKPTCAPHYYRIFRQKEKEAGRKVSVETHGMNAMTKGCLGGQSFAFVGNTGNVQICGFMDETAGDIRSEYFDFKKIWETSRLFLKMRDIDNYKGKCGCCEYRRVCGGCRARALAVTGDYLGEEPYCVYEPQVREPRRES
ncbi:MAG: radical SAM protein [Spirochaetota bacterium]